ncbi:unnamed protein product [Ceratitis capitata]|uniref:(Mediterranean fruit fly) hypothetical protein n=1 Tax=Ceratitis capitata TaxID=7213 RepID=A0A811VC40_CERCA|nr:unnamed protein product [Ceratitis capitata]
MPHNNTYQNPTATTTIAHKQRATAPLRQSSASTVQRHILHCGAHGLLVAGRFGLYSLPDAPAVGPPTRKSVSFHLRNSGAVNQQDAQKF